jgi:uncharacterized RDD family membrane protein YckC
MSWYYHLNGENRGPIPAIELQSLHQSNVIALDTLVWTEGMAQWEPYQSSSALAPILTTPATTETCAECGRQFPEDDMLQYENAWVCATCKPLFFQRIKEGVVSTKTLVYGTVGRRFAAVFIDGLILDVFFLVPIFLIAGIGGLTHKGLTPGVNATVYLIQYGLPALYDIFFVGMFGATPGKMVMKLKIIRADGGRVSYWRAAGRHYAKMLSAIILGIGYLMACWDEEKRTLHDRICKTRVVVNNPS